MKLITFDNRRSPRLHLAARGVALSFGTGLDDPSVLDADGIAGTELDRNTKDALAPCTQVGTLLPVANPSDVETRLAALEARVEEVAADTAAARHLAAARDRDLADLGVKVDANRSAINALGQQTAGRFDRLEHEMRTGFAEMRGKLDQTAAGQQQIVDLLTTFISERDGQ